MKSTVIYQDKDIQIIGYDDDNGQRGNTFGLYENGIDTKTGGQRELIHMTVERNFFSCIEDVKAIFMEAIKCERYRIRERRERGDIIPLVKCVE